MGCGGGWGGGYGTVDHGCCAEYALVFFFIHAQSNMTICKWTNLQNFEILDVR